MRQRFDDCGIGRLPLIVRFEDQWVLSGTPARPRSKLRPTLFGIKPENRIDKRSWLHWLFKGNGAMFQLTDIRPLPAHRLYLRYDDGVEGEIDLSDLVGRGVFARLNEPGEFEKVTIGPSGEIQWKDEIDLCPDAMYMRITGKSPADVFSALRERGHEAELNA